MNLRAGRESREKILAAGRKVFSEQGYGSSSMRAIARTAGISVGGVYLYFKGKDDLYLTLMNEWMDALSRETDEALDGIEDPAVALKNFIQCSIGFAGRYRETILLQGKEAGFSFGSERKREFFRQRRSILERIIGDGIAAGAFAPCDPAEVAKVIFNVLRGYVVSMMIEDDALFTSEACLNLILNGLMRRKTS
jgi:AcrR family transcriptional regulator